MSETGWAYHCELWLKQGACGEYVRDEESRGAAQGYTGCPSCVHRRPADDATQEADIAWGLRWLWNRDKERPRGQE